MNIKSLTPNQFLKECTNKPVFVYVKSVAEVSVPVRVTKSALKKGLKLGDPTELRFVENEMGFFITIML